VAAETPTNPSSSDNGSESGQTGTASAERRRFVRVRPDENNPLAAKLTSGADVRLIDLSRGGAQFECERRFLPNSTVSLRLMTRDDVVTVSGRVVRSRIVRLASGGLGYVVAVAFYDTLKIPLESHEASSVAASRPGAPASTPPATESDAAGAVDPIQSAPSYEEPDLPASVTADITAEEALAFESSLEAMPPMFTLTATVDATSEQLHDMFNGNDW
jgi:hypothetical protein